MTIKHKHLIPLLSRLIAMCLIVQIAISWKLWIPIDRSFPMVSAFSSLDFSMGIIGDSLLTTTLLLGLLLVILQKQTIRAVILITSCFVLLILEDITRLQPWVYNQSILLLLLAQYKKIKGTTIISGVLLLLSLVYLWSGIQKMNLGFIRQTFPWLLSGLNIDVTGSTHQSYYFLRYLFAAVALYEFFIGVLLLFSKKRKLGICLAIIMHLFILLSLGPTGHHWNIVVWPWNITLILMLILIYKVNEPIYLFRHALSSHLNKVIVLLFGILPALNFAGYWDKSLSGSLYSGTDSTISLFYNSTPETDLATLNLPQEKSDDNHYDSKTFLMYWSMDEMQVPYYQSHRHIKRYVQVICEDFLHSSQSKIELNHRAKISSAVNTQYYNCSNHLDSISN